MTDSLRDDPAPRTDPTRAYPPRSHRGLAAAARMAEVERDTAAVLAELDAAAPCREDTARRLRAWAERTGGQAPE